MSYETELRRTVDRVRQLSDARLSPHRSGFESLITHMTERDVPVLEPRAWADQLWLIGSDVPGSAQPVIEAELTEFRRGLDLVPG